MSSAQNSNPLVPCAIEQKSGDNIDYPGHHPALSEIVKDYNRAAVNEAAASLSISCSPRSSGGESHGSHFSSSTVDVHIPWLGITEKDGVKQQNTFRNGLRRIHYQCLTGVRLRSSSEGQDDGEESQTIDQADDLEVTSEASDTCTSAIDTFSSSSGSLFEVNPLKIPHLSTFSKSERAPQNVERRFPLQAEGQSAAFLRHSKGSNSVQLPATPSLEAQQDNDKLLKGEEKCWNEYGPRTSASRVPFSTEESEAQERKFPSLKHKKNVALTKLDRVVASGPLCLPKSVSSHLETRTRSSNQGKRVTSVSSRNQSLIQGATVNITSGEHSDVNVAISSNEDSPESPRKSFALTSEVSDSSSDTRLGHNAPNRSRYTLFSPHESCHPSQTSNTNLPAPTYPSAASSNHAKIVSTDEKASSSMHARSNFELSQSMRAAEAQKYEGEVGEGTGHHFFESTEQEKLELDQLPNVLSTSRVLLLSQDFRETPYIQESSSHPLESSEGAYRLSQRTYDPKKHKNTVFVQLGAECEKHSPNWIVGNHSDDGMNLPSESLVAKRPPKRFIAVRDDKLVCRADVQRKPAAPSRSWKASTSNDGNPPAFRLSLSQGLLLSEGNEVGVENQGTKNAKFDQNTASQQLSGRNSLWQGNGESRILGGDRERMLQSSTHPPNDCTTSSESPRDVTVDSSHSSIQFLEKTSVDACEAPVLTSSVTQFLAGESEKLIESCTPMDLSFMGPSSATILPLDGPRASTRIRRDRLIDTQRLCARRFQSKWGPVEVTRDGFFSFAFRARSELFDFLGNHRITDEPDILSQGYKDRLHSTFNQRTERELLYTVEPGGMAIRIVDAFSGECFKRYDVNKLPKRQRIRYDYALRLLDGLRSRVAKIVIRQRGIGTFKLMSNSPMANFCATFADLPTFVFKVVIMGQQAIFTSRGGDTLALPISDLERITRGVEPYIPGQWASGCSQESSASSASPLEDSLLTNEDDKGKARVLDSEIPQMSPERWQKRASQSDVESRLAEFSEVQQKFQLALKAAQFSAESVFQAWCISLKAYRRCLDLEADGNSRYFFVLRRRLQELAEKSDAEDALNDSAMTRIGSGSSKIFKCQGTSYNLGREADYYVEEIKSLTFNTIFPMKVVE